MMYRGLLYPYGGGPCGDGRPPAASLATNTLAVCSPHLTETECQAHQRILTFFGDLRKRAAYQAMHAQLIDERRATSGVPADKRPHYLVSLTH